jgi:phosphate transport system permease protein
MEKLKTNLFSFSLYLSLFFSLSLVVAFAWALATRGLPGLTLEFLTTEMQDAGNAGGVLWQILGGLILTLFSSGICYALSLALVLWRGPEQTNLPLQKKLFDSWISALHCVPSIVWGLIGFFLFVRLFGLGKSWLAGALTLGLLGVSYTYEIGMARVRAVPRDEILSAQSIGLSAEQISNTVLRPYAILGTLRAMAITLQRLAGETAPLLLTATVFSGVDWPRGFSSSPVVTLPSHIYVLAQEAFSEAAVRNVWASALTLILVSFGAKALLGTWCDSLERKHFS